MPPHFLDMMITRFPPIARRVLDNGGGSAHVPAPQQPRTLKLPALVPLRLQKAQERPREDQRVRVPVRLVPLAVQTPDHGRNVMLCAPRQTISQTVFQQTLH